MHRTGILLLLLALSGEAFFQCAQQTVRSCAIYGKKSAKDTPNLLFQQPLQKLASIVVSLGLFINPTSIHAATLEASQLFSSAEAATLITEKKFKIAEKEWTATKKLIEDKRQSSTKASETIRYVEKEVSDLSAKLAKQVQTGDQYIEKLRLEVDGLGNSVALKYTQAQEASNSKKFSPSAISKLFIKAQNEAFLLEQDTKQLTVLTEQNELSKQALAKVQVVLNRLEGIVANSLDIENQEILSNLKQLEDSFTKNIKFCKEKIEDCETVGKDSLALFKKASVAVVAAQDKADRLFKQVDYEFKNLEDVQKDILKIVNKLQARVNEEKQWETSKKLTLSGGGKSFFNSYLSDLSSAYKAFDDRIDDAESKYHLALEKNANRNKDKSVVVSLSNQMKRTAEEVESAQKQGVSANRLLTQAREKGQQEAQLYAQILKLPVNSPSAPTGKATVKSNK